MECYEEEKAEALGREREEKKMKKRNRENPKLRPVSACF
jgi:hypothetical protein